MQIKQLESVLGQPLFEHMGKHIYLTQAGQEAVRVARAIEGELANREQTLADLQGLTGGTLVVSAASTASVFAARAMALFRARHPDVHLSLNVVNRATLAPESCGTRIYTVGTGRSGAIDTVTRFLTQYTALAGSGKTGNFPFYGPS